MTALQIVQFVVDLVGIYYAVGYRMVFGPQFCVGTDYGAAVGVGIISSYLLLFVQFYIDTYNAKKKKAKKAKAENSPAELNGHGVAVIGNGNGLTHRSPANGGAANGNGTHNGNGALGGNGDFKKQR